MNYWWANCKSSHADIVANGRLRTELQKNGILPIFRSRLLKIEPGDVIFLYWDGAIRALAEATAMAEGFVDSSVELNPVLSHADFKETSWILPVDILDSTSVITRGTALEIIGSAAESPFDVNGRGKQQFLHQIQPQTGQALVEQLGLHLGEDDESIAGHALDFFTGQELDSPVIASMRNEQRALRKALLGQSSEGRCALCHKTLPADLLVAAHIKPRSACSDDEKSDLTNSAMLACLLGCDALFERGFIYVDDQGVICADDAQTQDVKAVIHPLVGQRCLAFSMGTRDRFAAKRAILGLVEEPAVT